MGEVQECGSCGSDAGGAPEFKAILESIFRMDCGFSAERSK
jgi:hypothetical protein